MISRLMRHFTREEATWDCYFEILAALPENH
jgi:hypothetical protein